MNKVLIGNKSDWTDKRAVTEDQGRELAEELGIKFIETSAKINEGVEDAFFTLARSVCEGVFCFRNTHSPLTWTGISKPDLLTRDRKSHPLEERRVALSTFPVIPTLPMPLRAARDSISTSH